ncbi:MAG: single-stranded DNA-binding protein [Defluviitaleaceae bacterium]|nr:single-stranded DNA-binding protein [Defluviitaleaceae bacterium]MCL2238745.1 single-stranded DNA-binding protein [Defluviitaleaceae bacterium]
MNKVILMGRLTKDPEIRYSQAAEPVCVARYTLAVNKRFKKEGEPDADFITCVSFRKTAEFAERYLKRGMQINVCGSLQVRTYDDNTGQRRWVTEVVVDEAYFTESKSAYEARISKSGGFDEGGFGAPPPAAPPAYEPEGFSAITQSIDDDDLPF